MRRNYFIQNATIINEGQSFSGSVLVLGDLIARVYRTGEPADIPAGCTVIDAAGRWLLPGVIDTHVHFREPGATRKADMAVESRAAAAGGVTSFIDMPNNTPATATIDLVRQKLARAADTSCINYSCYLGASGDNIDEIKRIDPREIAGVKLFMGASTGSLLVTDPQQLAAVFAESPVLVATHCEDDHIIRQNEARLREKYEQHGWEITAGCHSLIRSSEACLRSTEQALELAIRYGTRLHVLHITTSAEAALFVKGATDATRITAEACVPHLWFYENAYFRLGNKLKCNPAIKSLYHRTALRSAVSEGRITTIATDHAPHLLDEKMRPYREASSGMPSVQFALPLMLELCRQGIFTPETVVTRMCHAPAELFHIRQRGFIREGYYADIVLVDPAKAWRITDGAVLSKCAWTPYTGTKVSAQVTHTFVNGCPVYENGRLLDGVKGQQLVFDR